MEEKDIKVHIFDNKSATVNFAIGSIAATVLSYDETDQNTVGSYSATLRPAQQKSKLWGCSAAVLAGQRAATDK